MKIETKYNIGDGVWFMNPITVRPDVCKIVRIDIVIMKKIKITYTMDYGLGVDEIITFPTKQELLKSLE